jgi:beta-ketodecanoyl-[acyl-carrier-protein] synthase
VFKEVVPMVASMIVDHAGELGIDPAGLRRLWLHQANQGMNRLIAQRVLGHEASEDESPTVLDTYGNTSSAGSIIAFHLNNEDLVPGDKGLICSFGAGYSVGTVFVRKVA